MDNGIRILTEDEFKKMSVSIERRVQMSDVAYYFSNKNTRMSYEPYLLETGSVPKIVKNDGTIHEFKALKMGQKFDVDLQGRVVAVPNYNFEILKKMGIRPVIPLSMIPKSITGNTINNFSYGYYPIIILDKLDQDLITNMFLNDTYNKWGSITINGRQYHVIEIFTIEYGYRRIINLLEHHNKFKKEDFSDFTTRDNVDYMWSRLEQIEWTIDKNLGLAIADFIPMTDIDFNDTFYYKSFKDTNLYKWLNSEFLDTIMRFEDEKLIIPKKNNKKKEEVVNENNNNIFDIDLSNFSFANIDTQKNNRKKELGIDNESIEEFKKKIKNVTEEEAENLGKKLFNRLFNGNYNDDNYDDVLKLIIDGANVNYRSAENKLWFPLFICARKNYLKTSIVLIQAGANINMVTNYGMSSAMVAASCGNKEILEILISMGADINIKDFYGNTALSFATFSNEMECARMLADAGAHLNSTNLDGQTIVEYDKQKKDNFSADELFEEASKMLQDISGNQKIKKK